MTMILGHRGARLEAPENTLAGFEHLRSVVKDNPKVQGVEFDVQLSADGVLMVAHDVTLLRKAGLARRISDMSSEEISNISLKKLKNTASHIADLVTPKLSEVLPLVSDFAHVELEIKTHSRTSIDKLEAALLKLRDQMPTCFTLTSFNASLLYQLKGSGLKTGLLIDAPLSAEYVLAQAKLLGVSRVCPHYKLINAELVEQLHQKKLKISTWTVNKKSQAKKLQAMGVDALISDKPRLIAEVIKD